VWARFPGHHRARHLHAAGMIVRMNEVQHTTTNHLFAAIAKDLLAGRADVDEAAVRIKSADHIQQDVRQYGKLYELVFLHTRSTATHTLDCPPLIGARPVWGQGFLPATGYLPLLKLLPAAR